MRFDLLQEHDRFIPGWHGQVQASPMRAEWSRPEWRWPPFLRSSLARIARWGLTALTTGLRRGRNTAVAEASRSRSSTERPWYLGPLKPQRARKSVMSASGQKRTWVSGGPMSGITLKADVRPSCQHFRLVP